jgi:hypothetical protein
MIDGIERESRWSFAGSQRVTLDYGLGSRIDDH